MARFHLAQTPGGVDEANVGEGLGEVAPHFAGVWVGFLGEQADIVGESVGALEELGRPLYLAGQGEALDQPVGADEEPIVIAGPAVHEPVGCKLPLDRLDGGAYAGVVCRQKTDQCPACGPSSRAKIAGESKRGEQYHSSVPSRRTRAAD